MFVAQCRSIKIHIAPGEKVPMQVDGEAWLQEPGIVSVVHKNRARMLAKNKVSIDLHFLCINNLVVNHLNIMSLILNWINKKTATTFS